MLYKEIIKKLHGISNSSTVRPVGLERISKILELLHNPHHKFKTIHVAGTNGKGTTVLKVAKALEQTKKRVGMYTSPHISSFRERIAINGELIFEEDVVRHFLPLFQIAEEHSLDLSYFEYLTAGAFSYFAEKKCDIVVVETGLGGRFDATNVIHPLVSVITSISLDHTALLGKTIEQITYEKAGIIKRERPVVIGPQVSFEYIEKIATVYNAPLYQVKGHFSNFEEENGAIAWKILELLHVPKNVVELGLKACPSCRFEAVPKEQILKLWNKNPHKVILDVGHNPDAIEKLFLRVQNTFPGFPVFTIYGASCDKDYHTCIHTLIVKSEQVTFVAAETTRAVAPKELAAVADQYNSRKVVIAGSLEEAVRNNIDVANEREGVLVVCGTFYIMAQVRKLLGFSDVID